MLIGDRLGEVCGVALNENMSKHYRYPKPEQYDLNLYREEYKIKVLNSGLMEPEYGSLDIIEQIDLEKKRQFPFRSNDIARPNIDEETGSIWLNGKPTFMFLSLEYLKDDSYVII